MSTNAKYDAELKTWLNYPKPVALPNSILVVSESGCYFIGSTLVHTPDCSCDQEVDEGRDHADQA